MAVGKLPFNEIMCFCDGRTLRNILRISTINRTVYQSDIVKAVSNRLSVKYIHRIPERHHLLFLKYLVRKGRNVLENGYAIQSSCRTGRLDVLQYLVLQGGDIRSCNDYALQLASEYGHLHIVIYLISQGANVKAANNYAVICASGKGHIQEPVSRQEKPCSACVTSRRRPRRS